MAIVQSESFAASTAFSDFTAYGLLSASLTTKTGATIQTSGGPSGQPYLNMSTSQGSTNTNYWCAFRALPSVMTTITVGMMIRANSFAAGFGGGIGLLSSGGTLQNCFEVNSSGAVVVWRGGIYTGTQIGTSVSGLVSPGVWKLYEIEATISTSVGSYIVRLNGTQILSLSGVDNAADSTNQNVANIVTNTFNNIGSNANFDFAQLYATDSTAPNAGFLGPVLVYGRFPTANSAVTFTPNGLANNYQNAANIPPAPATDYNSDSTVGAQDTFSAAALPSGLGSVLAVSVKSLFQDTTANSRTVENVLISGATTATGTAFTPPVTPSATYQCDIWNTDPNTSAAWTEANAQATTFGYKIAS